MESLVSSLADAESALIQSARLESNRIGWILSAGSSVGAAQHERTVAQTDVRSGHSAAGLANGRTDGQTSSQQLKSVVGCVCASACVVFILKPV